MHISSCHINYEILSTHFSLATEQAEKKQKQNKNGSDQMQHNGISCNHGLQTDSFIINVKFTALKLHVDSEICVAYINYKVMFVTIKNKNKKQQQQQNSKLMLGNEIAAMKKTYYYDTNTETMWLSYGLLYSLQHHLDC